MIAMHDGRLIGTRLDAAALVNRHPDQIRRRCTPIGTDPDGRAIYDLDAVHEAFRHTPRRVKLT